MEGRHHHHDHAAGALKPKKAPLGPRSSALGLILPAASSKAISEPTVAFLSGLSQQP